MNEPNVNSVSGQTSSPYTRHFGATSVTTIWSRAQIALSSHWTRMACVHLTLTLLLTMSADGWAQSRDANRESRLQMVAEFLVKEGIENRRVLAAMQEVPRHEFVLTSYRRVAYTDAAWPIGHGQTISPPFIVAYMTETIDPQPTDRVLEIGTGSGYQAAVLSELAKDVYTIEIVEALGKTADRRLKKMHYDNVHTRIGDGYQGWPEAAPFDKIIVTCSPENVPAPLVAQLREGGRMIIPLGERYQQVFYLFEKRDGKLVQKKLVPTLFVPMTGISEDKRRVQPDPAHPELLNGSFEDDENNDGRADHWHYQRQTKLVQLDAPDGKNYLLLKNEEPGRLSQLLQGMAIDGRRVAALRFGLDVYVHGIRPGKAPHEKPALMVHFYDGDRRSVGDGAVGPWIHAWDWREAASTIKVPAGAREAIVRIGLNGATGQIRVDGVRMKVIPR